MGIAQKTAIVIEGTRASFYPKGIYKTATPITKNLASKTYGNNTVYRIPLQGSSEEENACPYDAVIFKPTSTRYNYEFFNDKNNTDFNKRTEIGKEITVTNTNDSRNTVVIYTNGSATTWEGGVSGVLTYLGELLSPERETSAGYGWVVTSKYDNGW